MLRSLARSRRFRTYSGGTVPIYFTEYAVIKGYGGIRSEAQRASRTVSDFKYMKRQGIKQIIWYHLVIYPSTVRDYFPSGILNTNGTGCRPTTRSSRRAAPGERRAQARLKRRLR